MAFGGAAALGRTAAVAAVLKGYMDVVALARYGINYAIASLWHIDHGRPLRIYYSVRRTT